MNDDPDNVKYQSAVRSTVTLRIHFVSLVEMDDG